MGFVAASGDHAIVEAIFGIEFSRAWLPKEIEAIVGAHANWKAFLPKQSRSQLHQIGLGPLGVVAQPAVIPAQGVFFDRVKPDGNIGWRMKCDQNTLFVNCLEYSGWSEVWPKVQELMSLAIQASGAEDLFIKSLTLQYIDQFYWDSDEASYNLHELLNFGGEYVPPHIANAGIAWHLHQGWFDPNGMPIPGKVLNRVHFDAMNQDTKPSVRIDTLLRHDVASDVQLPVDFSKDEGIDQILDSLHTRLKDVLGNFLSQNTVKAIGLGD